MVVNRDTPKPQRESGPAVIGQGGACNRRQTSGVQPLLEGPVPAPHRSGVISAPAQTGRGHDDRVCRELSLRIRDFGERVSEDEAGIRSLLSRLDAIEINNLRYQLFAPYYDKHMLGHETAIANLLGQFASLQSAAYPDALMGDSILEMSCGTGSVIDHVCRLLPPSRLPNMRITANDWSEDMKSIAREKLRIYPCQFTYASEDLGELSFKRGTFNTVFLSQTLHLIIDSDVQRQERESNYMFIDENRHLTEKLKVLRNAWWTLKERGVMVIIDEWPALLSDRGGPLGPGFAYLFNDGLRPADLRMVQESVMSQLPSARYICQLKVPIDRHHHMYLIAYRKEHYEQGRLPETPGAASLREAAFQAVMLAFASMDEHLRIGMNPRGGERPYVDFLPIATPVVATTLADIPTAAGSCDCIVLRQCMHTRGKTDRFNMISASMNALTVGGALVFIDEWLPPQGSPHPLRQTDLGSVYMGPFFRNLVSAGAVRVPIYEGFENSMYGYQFRKVI
jgi:SAM-dependent methyltransferase